MHFARVSRPIEIQLNNIMKKTQLVVINVTKRKYSIYKPASFSDINISGLPWTFVSLSITLLHDFLRHTRSVQANTSPILLCEEEITKYYHYE